MSKKKGSDKSVLDYLEDTQTSDDFSDKERRMAKLFVEGVEYFAPTKAEYLRIERNTDELVHNADVPII